MRVAARLGISLQSLAVWVPPPGLPCPPLDIVIDVHAGAGDVDLDALPSRAGILVMEGECATTLALLRTGNLRRAAMNRLGPASLDSPRSRREDLRGYVRRVLATTVGSAFEADWAFLQLARHRLPGTYRSMIDRWQAWFAHCDPTDTFPQWVKTARPERAPTGERGTYIGPFADKHSAHRFIEMLEDTFDLCRYHHILVQAPNANACAYKEMGKCPAPCDGSVTMSVYRAQVEASRQFALRPHRVREDWLQDMRARSAAMDFEAAGAVRDRLERSAKAERYEFSRIADLANFRYVVLAPSERSDWVRLFCIDRGWVAPILDMSRAAVLDQWDDLSHEVLQAVNLPSDFIFSTSALENIAMATQHMLLPRTGAGRSNTLFLHQSKAADKGLITKLVQGLPMPGSDFAIGDGPIPSHIAEAEFQGLEESASPSLHQHLQGQPPQNGPHTNCG